MAKSISDFDELDGEYSMAQAIHIIVHRVCEGRPRMPRELKYVLLYDGLPGRGRGRFMLLIQITFVVDCELLFNDALSSFVPMVIFGDEFRQRYRPRARRTSKFARSAATKPKR